MAVPGDEQPGWQGSPDDNSPAEPTDSASPESIAKIRFMADSGFGRSPPSGRAISAFTRVFDALWRGPGGPPRNDGMIRQNRSIMGCRTSLTERRTTDRAPTAPRTLRAGQATYARRPIPDAAGV
jgi:hypothetical protein